MTGVLLAADEPHAYEVHNRRGSSAFLLVCDHAANRLPRALGDLGLSEHERARHIAWDIGAAEVAQRVSVGLDACLVLQNYSRLVIDCNRPPGSPESIVRLSEETQIPGNEQLSDDQVAARRREIFDPYHDCIRGFIDERLAAARPPILLSVHSFVPSYRSVARPWHAGVLYLHEARLARALMALLRAKSDFLVGDNQPYRVSEDTDYTVIVHGERRQLLYCELEIRQDLIADGAGQRAWADRLIELLPLAYARALEM